tara:strand:- start:74 stop:727 length:654 start_codon:yes stop_codon:yes gene_type:complete
MNISAASSSEAVFVGLKLYELLTLFGVFAGPLVAVGVTLWVDWRRRRSDARTHILRMILTTRRLPSDPAYLMAINLIEIEFNDCDEVMTARREYMELVRKEVSADRHIAHNQELMAKQATMIHHMMRRVGLKSSESQIITDAYVSDGFINRDNLYLDSLKAMRDVASAIGISNWLVAKSMGQLDANGQITFVSPVSEAPEPTAARKTRTKKAIDNRT